MAVAVEVDDATIHQPDIQIITTEPTVPVQAYVRIQNGWHLFDRRRHCRWAIREDTLEKLAVGHLDQIGTDPAFASFIISVAELDSQPLLALWRSVPAGDKKFHTWLRIGNWCLIAWPFTDDYVASSNNFERGDTRR